MPNVLLTLAPMIAALGRSGFVRSDRISRRRSCKCSCEVHLTSMPWSLIIGRAIRPKSPHTLTVPHMLEPNEGGHGDGYDDGYDVDDDGDDDGDDDDGDDDDGGCDDGHDDGGDDDDGDSVRKEAGPRWWGRRRR